MNAAQRKLLEKWSAALEDAHNALDELQQEEQDKYDNLSEGLQASERGQAMEAAANALAEAVSSIEDAMGSIEEAMQ